MEGRVGQPSNAVPPLVGRQHVLRTFRASLDAAAAGTCQFLGLIGEPGTGKTRLLVELAAIAADQKIPVFSGRAAEFERLMPFGVVIDALDDHLESCADTISETLDTAATRSLAKVFPSLSAVLPGEPEPDADVSGLSRYRLYRTIRQLLDELARQDGLVLMLDDAHWADNTSVELLDHLVRHPPRGQVLITVAYRPAQVPPRLAALFAPSAQTADPQGLQAVSVEPLNQAEVEQLLGADVSRTRARRLYEASGGNPFYLEALARMDPQSVPLPSGPDEGELPRSVDAALQVELDGLSPAALRLARAAAVAGDEFAPELAAVAADVPADDALTVLDELMAHDIVRPAAAVGRFQFRHPLVQQVAYRSAAPGWRLAAHARIAAQLADGGAPATARAHHVEQAARFGDEQAIGTLVEAARTVAPQAPATAAHWLRAAERLLPEPAEGNGRLPSRLELLMELAHAQAVSGHVADGRETARTLLRLLPAEDYDRRARVARLCALMERMLGRPHQGRTVLLDELHKISDPQSTAAVTLRLRLVADSLIRNDHRAAQAVLDLMPDSGSDWGSGLTMAAAALRPLPALGARRFSAAIRYIDAADQLVAAASDEHIAEWLDVFTWLCWTETMMSRHLDARQHFERALTVARSTGQSYMVPHLLAGQARTYLMLGELAEAATAAEEGAEVARLFGTGQELVMAMTQQCLVASWSGDDAVALRLGREAKASSAGTVEWWGAMAQYAHALALINAGQTAEGAEEMTAACDGFRRPKLDPAALMSCCELMARVEATAGRIDEAARWADRADKLSHPKVKASNAFARLTRAHAARQTDPANAAALAHEAAEIFADAELRLDSGRARLAAGAIYVEAGDRDAARAELRTAAEIFAACGARALRAQTIREQRRLGVRVPAATSRGTGTYGLSGRESEVAALVAEGYTNHQIAEKLFISDRTVETHLSRIFTKLGVTSRVGVATTLTQSDE
jgi:DNA-binding CsgD family transcriptional regulator